IPLTRLMLLKQHSATSPPHGGARGVATAFPNGLMRWTALHLAPPVDALGQEVLPSVRNVGRMGVALHLAPTTVGERSQKSQSDALRVRGVFFALAEQLAFSFF